MDFSTLLELASDEEDDVAHIAHHPHNHNPPPNNMPNNAHGSAPNNDLETRLMLPNPGPTFVDDLRTFLTVDSNHVFMDRICCVLGNGTERLHELMTYLDGLRQGKNEEVQKDIANIANVLYSGYRLTVMRDRTVSLLQGQSIVEEHGMFAVEDENVQENRKPIHDLLDHVYTRCYEEGLKKRDGELYRPRWLPSGENSRCYEHWRNIAEFIHNDVRRIVNEDVYLILSMGNNARSCVEHMTSYNGDARLPELKRSRYHWSFGNGIVDGRAMVFYAYEPVPGHPEVPTVHDLDPSICTVKYFPDQIDHRWFAPNSPERTDPSLVQCEVFEKICDGQEFPPDVVFWASVLCGRMCFDVNDKDGWQVSLFARGTAGTGKSSLLSMVAMFYDHVDTGYVVTDGQQTFSDEHLLGCLIALAMDVDEKMRHSHTRFNLYASGDFISINRKHKVALNIKWTIPFAMASNSRPPWTDRSGSLARRLVILLFDHVVKNIDTDMMKRAREQTGKFLLRCLFSYDLAVKKHGGGSLWSTGVLPKHFHDARQHFLAECNQLVAFLSSEYVQCGPEYSQSLITFRSSFAKYVRDNELGKVLTVTASTAGHELGMKGATIVTDPATNRQYIMGLRVLDEEGQPLDISE
jgi:hypothetical protein